MGRFCSRCGARSEGQGFFCTHCGAPLSSMSGDPAARGTAPAAPGADGRRQRSLVVLVIVLAVIAAVLAILLVTGDGVLGGASDSPSADGPPGSGSSDLSGTSWSGKSLWYSERLTFMGDGTCEVWRGGDIKDSVSFTGEWSQSGSQVTIVPPGGAAIVCDVDGNRMIMTYAGENISLTRMR